MMGSSQECLEDWESFQRDFKEEDKIEGMQSNTRKGQLCSYMNMDQEVGGG